MKERRAFNELHALHHRNEGGTLMSTDGYVYINK